ncbi:MAG TPA: hypothetical protein VEP69_02525 [Thermodesulfovibrionales bacterium]|nr:hypothetical protein [Thermodesulfovibrionales bacterium]
MDQFRSKRHIRKLLVLTIAGLAFIGWLSYHHTLIGAPKADGTICVLFGLFLCAHPAAYVLDMFFFSRSAGRQFSSGFSAALWAALNMLVLVIGWFIIFIGTTQLAERSVHHSAPKDRSFSGQGRLP